MTSSREEIRTAYYCDNTKGGEMVAVYGDRIAEGAIVLPRLVLGQYVLLAAVAALILGIAWLLFYRRKKLQRAVGLLQLMTFSYLLGHLLIKGMETVSYSMPRDFVMIVFTAVGIYGLILFGILLKRQRKR